MKKIMAFLLVILLASIASASASISISAINFDAPGNDHNNLNGEWIQITNSGSTSMMMSGWTLSDEGNKHTYRFPQSFGLNPGASATLYTGCGPNSANALYWCEPQAVWNNDGDIATLIDSSGNIMDRKGN